MAYEPSNWNVLLVGAWNVAILTPDGIRRRLLQLPEGTPVEIHVALDRPGTFKVAHDGLFITPTEHGVEVTPSAPTLVALGRACGIGQRALEHLPETPVTAAGVNLRYRTTEVPDSLLEALRAPIDDVLSDGAFQLEQSEIRRTLAHAPGTLNLKIVYGAADGSGRVEFNFHRASDDPSALREWLGRCHDFGATAERLLNSLGVEHALVNA